MWIATNKFFCSIVQDVNNKDKFLIRFRSEKHAKAFQKLVKRKYNIDTSADYKYRMYIPKYEFIAVMTLFMLDIDYPNFKDSVDDPKYHNILLEMWFILRRYQEDENALKIGKVQEDYFEKYFNRD